MVTIKHRSVRAHLQRTWLRRKKGGFYRIRRQATKHFQLRRVQGILGMQEY